MEEKIKEIIAVFIKVPSDQIGPGTAIGRAALQSSILLHRMYARLAEEGVIVENCGDIKVFADLWPQRLAVNGSGSVDGPGSVNDAGPVVNRSPDRREIPAGSFTPGIGIDIEEIAAMPRTPDFRKEAFYSMNFTNSEIAYCILQADPYSSFAGLFAVKEAIVKADGQLRRRDFNKIEIGHSSEGKPFFPGFSLSISHSAGVAVAIAAQLDNSLFHQPAGPAFIQQVSSDRQGAGSKIPWITLIALLLSVLALLIVLTH